MKLTGIRYIFVYQFVDKNFEPTGESKLWSLDKLPEPKIIEIRPLIATVLFPGFGFSTVWRTEIVE